MRKISELPDICKKHHEICGGPEIAMCHSAIAAIEQGEITNEEFEKVKTHSMRLIEEIDPESGYLYEALGLDRKHEPDRLKLEYWWENHINNLKEKGL